jgi:hypothetical protein
MSDTTNRYARFDNMTKAEGVTATWTIRDGGEITPKHSALVSLENYLSKINEQFRTMHDDNFLNRLGDYDDDLLRHMRNAWSYTQEALWNAQEQLEELESGN